MASTDPFNIGTSSYVPSIPCTHCGSNMHCVRRTPEPSGEHQWFACTCGNATDRTVGLQPSDAAIQSAVEKSLGMQPKSA